METSSYVTVADHESLRARVQRIEVITLSIFVELTAAMVHYFASGGGS